MISRKHNIRFLLFLTFIFSTGMLKADVVKPVKWKASIERVDEKIFEVSFKATIDDGWHLYGLDIPPNGPYPVTFNYIDSSIFSKIDNPRSSVKPEKKFDKTFEMDLELFHGSVVFKQKLITKEQNPNIEGFVEFMACDDSRCLPPSNFDFEFTFSEKEAVSSKETSDLSKIKPLFQTQQLNLGSGSGDESLSEQSPSENSTEISTAEEQDSENEEEMSLWDIFIRAISKGLIAIFTPCVFPIIPLTVAFFMRDNSKGKRIFQALFFGFSIVLIYAAVGLVAGIFQIDLTELTKNWVANIVIFSILVIFAASFFGMFELVLPGSLSNKLDSQVDKGGFLAPFFLALVTAVVSFSCVGPIAGVAIGDAMNGEIISPVIAMIGFSGAFALPFVIIGIFPGLLKNMPKSGGWLNAVKVFFAFLMLIAAYIFLGNTQWDIFSRDVIIALNIVTYVLLGFYLLGKLKFAHDSDLTHIGVPRLLLAIIAFTMAIYLVPGLFGSPLKMYAPLLPAQETSELNLHATKQTIASKPDGNISNQAICNSKPKYSDLKNMKLPHGLKGYFDLQEALLCAKELNKPVLIDFVGHTCKNCKKMYAEVWSDPFVQQKLAEDFVLVALYTDDKFKLPEAEWTTSSLDGRVKKTLGKKNLDYQITTFNSNALPMYVIVDSNGNIITKSKEYYTYSNNIQAFLDYLDEGLTEYSN